LNLYLAELDVLLFNLELVKFIEDFPAVAVHFSEYLLPSFYFVLENTVCFLFLLQLELQLFHILLQSSFLSEHVGVGLGFNLRQLHLLSFDFELLIELNRLTLEFVISLFVLAELLLEPFHFHRHHGQFLFLERKLLLDFVVFLFQMWVVQEIF
jgi:hypothetical protein